LEAENIVTAKNQHRGRRSWCRNFVLAVLVILLAPAAAMAAERTEIESSLPPKQSAKIQKKWGLEVIAIRLSAAGSMVDFRYRVVDPDKAAFMTDRNVKAYLVDQATGRVLEVPTTAKIGPLRQTTPYEKPEERRIYFMLFGNPGRAIQSGNKVTLAIGDVRIKNLVVQ
jgi:hypothetical protein